MSFENDITLKFTGTENITENLRETMYQDYYVSHNI